MEEYVLSEAQLGLWNSRRGFQRGLIVGLGLAADQLTTLIVIVGPTVDGVSGAELARIQKQVPKWKLVDDK